MPRKFTVYLCGTMLVAVDGLAPDEKAVAIDHDMVTQGILESEAEWEEMILNRVGKVLVLVMLTRDEKIVRYLPEDAVVETVVVDGAHTLTRKHHVKLAGMLRNIVE